MLVVVQDGDAEVPQPLLDLEAARGRDVLEVDPPKVGDAPDGVDDVIGIGGVEHDRHRVDAAELLEEDRLALHDRQGRLGAEVAETEDRGAVGDHGNRPALHGQVPGRRRILADDLAGPRHARRVGEGQVARGVHAQEGAHLQLSPMELVDPQGFFVDVHGASLGADRLASAAPIAQPRARAEQLLRAAGRAQPSSFASAASARPGVRHERGRLGVPSDSAAAISAATRSG